MMGRSAEMPPGSGQDESNADRLRRTIAADVMSVELVSAFAGRQKILDAYQAAIDRKYRFYSYGDAMLII